MSPLAGRVLVEGGGGGGGCGGGGGGEGVFLRFTKGSAEGSFEIHLTSFPNHFLRRPR